jgi:lipopolysaccharide export LptBFGC system permease protein LptF
MTVACVLASATGIRHFTTSPEPGAAAVIRFERVYGRVGAFAAAIVFAVAALYLPRRPRFAWWLGLALGIISYAAFLYFVVTNSMRQPGADFVTSAVLPAVGISLIALFSGIQWYRRKGAFSDDDTNA